MAADIMFNIYDLMVNTLFGSVIMSGLAFMIFIAICGLIGRMSTQLLFFWILAYVITFGIGYIGALIAVLLFIGGAIYLFQQIVATVFPPGT